MKLKPFESATVNLNLRGVSGIAHGYVRGLQRVGYAMERHPWPVTAGTVITILLTGGAAYLYQRRKPTAAEVERRRREYLATHGRLVAGMLLDSLDAMADSVPPTTLFYRYRIAGVEYSCAQDLSDLAIAVDRLRLDLPVQVRYDGRNPGDSIVAAEHWSGLRN